MLGTSIGLATAAVGAGGVRAFLDYQATANAPDRILADGKQIYQASCANCHGDDGSRVPVAPLNAKAFLDGRGDATLFAVISNGKGAMPGWGKAQGGPLSPDQIRAVVAYLSNTAGHASSTLLAATGRDVYQAQCTGCHGDHGDRIPIAPLYVKGYLDTRSDAQLLDVVTHGKGFMPAFGEKTSPRRLKDEQIKAVVSYLRYSVETGLADEVSRGQSVYVSDCLGCHGEKGSRVPNVSLAAPSYLRGLGDGPLAQAITYGKGSMPGLQKTQGDAFNAADVSALVAYMKSWAGLPAGGVVQGGGTPLAGSPVGGGPLTLEGASPAVVGQAKDAFLKDCSGCHGESGDRVPRAQLASASYLGARTDDQLLQAIAATPGHASGALSKAGLNALPEADLRTIVALLRLVGGPAAKALSGAQVVQPTPATATAAGGAQTSAGRPASAAPAVSATAPASPSAAPAGAAAGDVSHGKDLFDKNCQMCHGPKGDQVPGVKLMDGSFLQQQDDTTLLQVITNGKGAMPTWGKAKGGSLSDDDIASVLAFLNSQAGLAPGGPAVAAGAGAPAVSAPSSSPAASTAAAGGSAPSDTSMPAAGTADAPAGDAAAAPGGARAPPDDPTLPVVDVTPAVGEELFKANCVMCHGEDGLRIPRVPLTSPTFGGRIPASGLKARIAGGAPAAGMPRWDKAAGGRLSDSQISAIVAYIESVAASRQRGDGS